MSTTNAVEIAQWFIKNQYDSPRDTYDGNMKLQKMLYFSQLVHLAKYGESLFDEEILAFKNGSVVEEVRQPYRNRNADFIISALQSRNKIDEKVLDTLTTVKVVFGDLNARELSDLNHLHKSWKEAYENSQFGPFHEKSLSVISIQQMISNELENMKEIIQAYEDGKNIINYEVVNGRKFYYDPNTIDLNDEVLSMLESFNGADSAYTITKDESTGILIY